MAIDATLPTDTSAVSTFAGYIRETRLEVASVSSAAVAASIIAAQAWAEQPEDELVDDVAGDYSALHYSAKAAASAAALSQDTMFDIDANLDLMPAENPIYSPHYELDINDDIQPRV